MCSAFVLTGSDDRFLERGDLVAMATRDLPCRAGGTRRPLGRRPYPGGWDNAAAPMSESECLFSLEDATPDTDLDGSADETPSASGVRGSPSPWVQHFHVHSYFDEGCWFPRYRHWPDPVDPVYNKDPKLYYFIVSAIGKPFWVRGDGLDVISSCYTWIPASIAQLIPGGERMRERQFFYYVYKD